MDAALLLVVGGLVIVLGLLTYLIGSLHQRQRDEQRVRDVQSTETFERVITAMQATNERVIEFARAVVVPDARQVGQQVGLGIVTPEDAAAMFSAFPEEEEDDEPDWTEEFVAREREDARMVAPGETLGIGKSLGELIDGPPT